MLLIPLKHENMEGRRWPIVTFTLIGLNILAFLATHWIIEKQQPEIMQVRLGILLLAATHDNLKMPEDVQQFVEDFSISNPEAWKEASSKSRKALDPWETRTMEMDPKELQEEMDALVERFHDQQQHYILLNYAFVPAHPKPISYVTSLFLHASWLHLIGNMWFLWLAGFILEENWGRAIYPVFYLLSGVAASQFHLGMYPHSIIPCLGASGAVAALMGAFLIRFPKLKIDMWALVWLLVWGIRFRFKAPAYSLLPLWLATEVFYGALVGRASGVAHWAHVGGFVFGAIAAVVIRKSGLEQKANLAIENKVGWTADPAIVQGTTLMEQGKLDEAIGILKKYVATKPDAVDAYALLHQLYWRKNDLPSNQQVAIKLCELHLKSRDSAAAWQDYQEFKNFGGQHLPAPLWLEFGRLAETEETFSKAVSEYESLASAYPTEKQSILALISAGRLSLKKLNSPAKALSFYKAAAESPVPHGEWNATIEKGIQEAEKALANPVDAAPAP